MVLIKKLVGMNIGQCNLTITVKYAPRVLTVFLKTDIGVSI